MEMVQIQGLGVRAHVAPFSGLAGLCKRAVRARHTHHLLQFSLLTMWSLACAFMVVLFALVAALVPLRMIQADPPR